MRVIPWEDSLNPEQQSLLVGSMLGDARLECRSKQGTARLRIHHADQQKDYVFWKYNLLKPLVLRPPWRTAWKDKRNGEIYVSWFFHTKTTAILESWWRFFYPEGTKILPSSFGSLLNPLALAVWFMDDGCFQEDSIILNTQSFSREEHTGLQQYFRERYGIEPSIQQDRRNVRLYFGKTEKDKVLSIITSHLLPSFRKRLSP